MRILLVSSGFYPEISPRSFRASELAMEFVRQGHDTTVITKYRDYDYTEFLKDVPLKLKRWRKPVLPVIPSFKNKSFSLISRMISRFLSILFEYPVIEEMFHVKDMLRKESGYDLMISFAVPHPVHWGVSWAKRSKHPIAGTWVADCGDPFMGNVLESFKKLFYFKYFEKWFCRKADFITIPLETAISAYYPEFHHKIKIIHQGFDFNIAETKKKHRPNRIPHFAYAGTFLQGIRDPVPLMRFLSELDMPFRFYLYTNQEEVISEFRPKLKEKLIVSGYITRDELIKKLSEMDFLINFDNNTTRNLPSKLIDYAITNRPVLNIKRRFNQEVVLEFLKGDYSNQMPLPDAENFHITHIARKFLDLISLNNI